MDGEGGTDRQLLQLSRRWWGLNYSDVFVDRQEERYKRCLNEGLSGFCFGINTHWMVECVAQDISTLLNLVDWVMVRRLQVPNGKFLSGVGAERGKWVEVKLMDDIQVEISSKPSDD